MIKDSGLAKKYAQAFFLVHKKRLTNKDHEALRSLISFSQKNRHFLALFDLKSMPLEDKKKVIDFIMHQVTFSSDTCMIIMTQLLHRLMQRKQVAILEEVLRQIFSLDRKMSGEERFVVTSSHVLSQDQEKCIVQFIRTHMSCQIVADFVVDTSLISGIRIQSASYLWEKSLAKQLREIEQKAQSGNYL